MTKRIEFFYDYGSPFSWFADLRMPAIAAAHAAEIVYRPVLLGAVVIGSGNTPPPTVPAKAAYYSTDMARWARRLAVDYQPNPAFPINSLTIMRGALVAQARGDFAPYHQAMWAAMWQQGRDLGDADVVREVIDDAGLDGEAILAGTADPDVKQALKANVDEALARGAFGLPTFFIGDELWFGNDRVDFVEDALRDA